MGIVASTASMPAEPTGEIDSISPVGSAMLPGKFPTSGKFRKAFVAQGCKEKIWKICQKVWETLKAAKCGKNCHGTLQNEWFVMKTSEGFPHRMSIFQPYCIVPDYNEKYKDVVSMSSILKSNTMIKQVILF